MRQDEDGEAWPRLIRALLQLLASGAPHAEGSLVTVPALDALADLVEEGALACLPSGDVMAASGAIIAAASARAMDSTSNGGDRERAAALRVLGACSAWLVQVDEPGSDEAPRCSCKRDSTHP